MENGKIDIHGYKVKLQSVIDRIGRNKELIPSNKKTLMEYKDVLFSEGLSNPRILKLLDQLERMGVWLGKPFKECEEKDIRQLVAKIEGTEKYSGWTKVGYKVSLKKFYKWLEGNGEEYPQKVKWVKPKRPTRKQMLPNEVFTEQEILDIINKGCISQRDRCIIALGYEILGRISEVGNCRVSDVDIKDGEGTIKVEGKGSSREVWIKFSIPYLREWLKVHPLRHKKDFQTAPLFVQTSIKQGFPAMKYSSYRKVIDSAVRRAGIQKKHNPHLLFRKSRASFLSDFLTERQLMAVGGWKDSDSVSHYIAKKETKNALKGVYGLEKEERKESILKPIRCSICGFTNEPNTKECEKCHNPLSIEYALSKKFQTEELTKERDVLARTIEKLLEKMSSMEKRQIKIEEALGKEGIREVLTIKG